jgi:electron transfer flavoprotein beta subunit
MRIGVLIKTVKFVYAQTGTEIKKNYICEDDIIAMVNPLDEIALEYALELKDRQPDVTVVAISLGDRSAEEGLRRSLAMGADKAVHIRYAEYEKLDAVASSAILARACERENFDLILCGATAIDDNEGLEGPYLAGRLQIPHVSGVVKISAQGTPARLEVQRVVERGDRQVLECSMPALLAVQRGSLVARYPTLAGILRAKVCHIGVLEPKALGFTGQEHLTMNLTEITGHSNPKPKKKLGMAQAAKLSAAQRIDLMVTRGTSKGKEGGNVVEGGSPEMFNRLDTILKDAGILKA